MRILLAFLLLVPLASSLEGRPQLTRSVDFAVTATTQTVAATSYMHHRRQETESDEDTLEKLSEDLAKVSGTPEEQTGGKIGALAAVIGQQQEAQSGEDEAKEPQADDPATEQPVEPKETPQEPEPEAELTPKPEESPAPLETGPEQTGAGQAETTTVGEEMSVITTQSRVTTSSSVTLDAKVEKQKMVMTVWRTITVVEE